jgi:hypothetical protein
MRGTRLNPDEALPVDAYKAEDTFNGTTSAAGRPAMAAEIRSPTWSLSVRTGSSERFI